MKKLLTIFAATLMAIAVSAGEITLAEGTTENTKLPVNGYYSDVSSNRTQFVYPAEELATVAGHTISALAFAAKTQSMEWGAAEFVVKLAEVEENTLSNFLSPEFTEVYSGKLSIVASTLEIQLAEAFAYSGQNLLVDISQTKAASFYDANEPTFYGVEAESAGYGSKTGSYGMASVVNFLPQVTISHDGSSGVVCPKPSQLTSAATPDGAVFTWEGEESQFQWCIVASGEEAAGWALLSAKTYTATGLNAGTEYDFYVRTYCDEALQSREAKVTFTPVCKAPEKVKMADLTHNSVTLSWDAVAGIEKYEHVCVRTGEEVDWTDVEAKAGLSVKLEDLEAQTSYDFYVRSWFSESTQSEAVKLTFTTNCVAATMPFEEDFEEADGLPTCWESNLYGDGGNAWSIGQWYKGDELINAARYSARSSSWTPADLKTAAVELSEHALLKFAYKNDVTAEVLIFDGSEETVLLNVPQDGWKDESIDLGAYTGKIVNIIFRGHSVSNASKYFYVDDVQIIAKPCEKPTSLNASESSDGALVTWQAGEDEAVWNLRYSVKDAEEWTEVKDLEETSYSISGLTTGTEYEVQVQAACTADKLSGWTDSEIFTPQCPTPEHVAVKNVTDNSAIVSWESAESAFIVEYRRSDLADWTKVENVQGLSFTLTELAASTAYKVRVQAACEGEYSSTRSFTTKCAPLTNVLPFSEDFEGVDEGALPECWERRSETEYPAVMATTAARGADEDNKQNCVIFQAENEQLLILPAIGDDLSEQSLTLYHRVSSSDANLEIGYLTDLYGEFVALSTLDNTQYDYSAPAELDLFSLPKTAKYLAIRYTATSSWTKAFIDDVQIIKTSEITAVSNTAVKAVATKRIVDGQLIIEIGGEQYNAQGVSVK